MLSVTRVLCDKTKQCTADILIPHEKQQLPSFSDTNVEQWLVGDAPFRLKYALKVTHPFEKHQLRQISAYNVSTGRDTEKEFNYDE